MMRTKYSLIIANLSHEHPLVLQTKFCAKMSCTPLELSS
jgi:hypothetical protein